MYKNKYSRTVDASSIMETENKDYLLLNEINSGHLVVLLEMQITLGVQRWMNFKTIKRQPSSVEIFWKQRFFQPAKHQQSCLRFRYVHTPPVMFIKNVEGRHSGSLVCHFLVTDIKYHLQAPHSDSSESSNGDNTPTFTLYTERLHIQATKATEKVCEYRMS